MPISLSCSACGQRLKAKESLAGRKVPCPKCGEKLLVPEPQEESVTYALQPDPPAHSKPAAPSPAAPPENEVSKPGAPEPTPSVKRVKKDVKVVSSLSPLTTNDLPLWLRHLHWLLVLALVPLSLSLLQAAKEDIGLRLKETVDRASPEEQKRIVQVLKGLDDGKGSGEELFTALPDKRLAGAFLPRDTWTHWFFALGSAVAFLSFIMLLGSHEKAQPIRLLLLGLFTATIGIAFLFIVQALAEWSQGVWLTGRSIVVILFYLVKLIGFSYRAALDPANGFLLSFFGYTFGVGFCEEVVKALPLLIAYRRGYWLNQNWHGAFLWGLASGAGFGISEGIMYSSSFYNGVCGPDMYVVRFVSCVALHALWTGSVGITINQKQWLIQGDLAWYEYIPRLFVIVGVPMVLHGLYDTLLKREMNALALVVALLSFGFLAFQISRLHQVDDQDSQKAMLREYKRRKKLMA
jgi:RsiW-degrading membrane proteinase PrsW (M82 family)/DNA-directed RNA polymerase subunit RPC12/RpoP